MNDCAMRTVLFLCTGNYYRSRFAEIRFNSLAAAASLPWRADSRGLALERGLHNIGPIAESALRRLQKLGVRVDSLRFPLEACRRDFETADRVIAVKEAEHRPLVDARFPAWAARVEYWHVHDLDGATADEALAEIEERVRALVSALRRFP